LFCIFTSWQIQILRCQRCRVTCSMAKRDGHPLFGKCTVDLNRQRHARQTVPLASPRQSPVGELFTIFNWFPPFLFSGLMQDISIHTQKSGRASRNRKLCKTGGKSVNSKIRNMTGPLSCFRRRNCKTWSNKFRLPRPIIPSYYRGWMAVRNVAPPCIKPLSRQRKPGHEHT